MPSLILWHRQPVTSCLEVLVVCDFSADRQLASQLELDGQKTKKLVTNDDQLRMCY